MLQAGTLSHFFIFLGIFLLYLNQVTHTWLTLPLFWYSGPFIPVKQGKGKPYSHFFPFTFRDIHNEKWLSLPLIFPISFLPFSFLSLPLSFQLNKNKFKSHVNSRRHRSKSQMEDWFHSHDGPRNKYVYTCACMHKQRVYVQQNRLVLHAAVSPFWLVGWLVNK